MDFVVRQHDADALHQLVEQRLRLLTRQAYFFQRRRGQPRLAQVFHQQRVRTHPIYLGHWHAAALQFLQRAVLVVQPRAVHQILAVARLLGNRAQVALILHDLFAALVHRRAALAIGLVVAEDAEHARPVDLARQVLRAGGGRGGATVDGGLFAALHLRQHVQDQVVVVELAQRIDDPLALVTRRVEGGCEAAACARRHSAGLGVVFDQVGDGARADTLAFLLGPRRFHVPRRRVVQLIIIQVNRRHATLLPICYLSFPSSRYGSQTHRPAKQRLNRDETTSCVSL